METKASPCNRSWKRCRLSKKQWLHQEQIKNAFVGYFWRTLITLERILKNKIVVKLCCVITNADHRISGSVNPSVFYPVYDGKTLFF